MDNFRYQPLGEQQYSFDCCDCAKSSIDYEALSYAWGSTDLVDRIQVNGQGLWVTESVFWAICCLRLGDQDRVLWIDAICIDQENDVEKSRQVAEMGTIFGSAKTVIFWLGKPTREAELLISYLKEHQAQRNLSFPLDDTTRKRTWSSMQLGLDGHNENYLFHLRKGLQSLLKRPWFDRVWILQEVANAQCAVVCAGVSSISAETFALSPRLLGVETTPHVQSVLDIMPGPTRDHSWWSEERDLVQLIRKFDASKASDERDLVFALLGLLSEANIHELVRVDYTKLVQEVIHDAVRYWFEATLVSIAQVLYFLTRFETVRVTYLISPMKTVNRKEAIPLPVQLSKVSASTKEALSAVQDAIECGRDASLLLVEQYCGQTINNNTCYGELDILRLRLDTVQLTYSGKYSGALQLVSLIDCSLSS